MKIFRVATAALLLACAPPTRPSSTPLQLQNLTEWLERMVPPAHLPPAYEPRDGEQFDYIVVGAGAAGCAAAARLARALPAARVLLVEAGGDPGPLSAIPMAAALQLGSEYDWAYRSEPCGACGGARGGRCRHSRGRALGGSTALNFMLHSRGSPSDYEYGLPGWTWDEFRPYFLRHEGFQDLHSLPNSSISHHNTTGPMKTQFFDDPKNEWHARLREGYRALGFPFNPDVDAASQIGVTRLAGYVHGGERMSAARAYLARARDWAALKVARRTRCTGVVIDERNVARGVRLAGARGAALSVRARREVLLAAGALATPHLLLLSGVGPARHLRPLGVPVRADLPVGENMSDHLLLLLFILVDGQSPLVTGLDALIQGVQWALYRNGTFASNGLTDLAAFANTRCYDSKKRKLQSGDGECGLPTVEMIHFYIPRGVMALAPSLLAPVSDLSDEVLRQLAAANAAHALLVACPVLLAPRARGTLRLASADPLRPPLISPNYLSDERDVDELLRAIGIVKDLVGTPAFEGASLFAPKLKSCPDAGGYWRCYARQLSAAAWHAAGGAALGGVLDARLRARGVRRLRAADLSALPRVPRGHPAAAALALGERVAEFLLQDNHGEYSSN